MKAQANLDIGLNIQREPKAISLQEINSRQGA